jgi:uncharacterized protein YjbI with pentapeptide repeats
MNTNNALIARKKFCDTGSYQREKEDLTFCLFENINFYESKRHISFFRSDFRGSKFSLVQFYKNNLDRADFISANFTNCYFEQTNFGGCEIKNCYFENTDFKNNQYKDASIQQCIFNNCTFSNEKFLVSMFDCTFINCNIIDCSFEMSTTERLSFNDCLIENVDLATMHAEMHSFINCNLKNVCIDSGYIFGYLICRTNIESVDFLYRGEKVNIDYSNIQKLYTQSRFFEYINANIIFKKYEDILLIIEETFEKIINYPAYLRKSELENILTAIIFYLQNNIIPFHIFIDIFFFITNYNWSIFSVSEKLSYLAKVETLKIMMNTGEYNIDFIHYIPAEIHSSVELHFQTEDYNSALEASKYLFHSISKELNIESTYNLINSRRGSWILLFSISTVSALLLPKIIKKYHNVICSIKITNSFCNRIINSLNKKNLSYTELELLAKTAEITVLNNKDDALSNVIDLLKVIRIDI